MQRCGSKKSSVILAFVQTFSFTFPCLSDCQTKLFGFFLSLDWTMKDVHVIKFDPIKSPNLIPSFTDNPIYSVVCVQCSVSSTTVNACTFLRIPLGLRSLRCYIYAYSDFHLCIIFEPLLTSKNHALNKNNRFNATAFMCTCIYQYFSDEFLIGGIQLNVGQSIVFSIDFLFCFQ